MSNDNAAPGWYPTPDGAQRYWDGARWTDQVADPGAPEAPGGGDQRPLWKKKRFLLPVALIVLLGLVFALGGDDAEPDEAAPTPTVEVTEAEDAEDPATPEETETEEAEAEETPEETETEDPNDPGEEDLAAVFDEMFGTFDTVTETGTGDAVLTLPEAPAGLVIADHSGSANFVVNVLDAGNEPTGDLLVNTIGDYEGTTAWGLSALADDGVKLQVTADGAWTIEIAPISSAELLEPSTEGQGDAVLLLGGPAADWAVTHDGEANFIVLQVGEGFPNLAVNDIGPYSGTVPLRSGPTVISVQADGSWSFTKS